VKKQVKNKEISPTTRKIKAACYTYLKERDVEEEESLIMVKSTEFAARLIVLLLADNTIIDNPHFKRGLPKYIRA
jgi:hypothetical protein